MDVDLEVFTSPDFDINGGIGNICLPKICRYIIDTPIFQRLRRIKQNGITDLVFPDTTHSRFVHSLATASLAYEFIKTLKVKHPTRVTTKDVLCITIAALVHDLGHGPFSHLFEEIFEGFCHEEMSKKLFMKIVNDYPEVRKGLAPLNDRDFELILQLIHPPSFDNIDNEWPLLVTREKAFLFAIVSNPLNGFDVDKIEYLIRDAARSGVQISFNKEVALLLISSVQICKHDSHDILWVAFSHKQYCYVKGIFETRKTLHQNVYSHRCILPASQMMKKAIQLSAPFLMYRGKNGNDVQLDKCSTDIDAYIKLDDSLYSYIRNSPERGMEEAQKILQDLEFRHIPKIVAKFDEIPDGKSAKSIQMDIETYLKNQTFASLDPKQIFTITKSFNAGKGDNDPLQHVLFYPRADQTQTCTFKDEAISSKNCIFVFAAHNVTEEESKKIFVCLEEFSKYHGMCDPEFMFKKQLPL